MSTPTLAWHNDPALKAAAVERMRKHREQDEFAQGFYLVADPGRAATYRGCFHGCLTAEALAVENNVPVADVDRNVEDWWEETERLYGIPARLGGLLDSAFEGMQSLETAARFAVEVTEAIPVGADLTVVNTDKLDEDLDAIGSDDEAIALVVSTLKATAPAEVTA